MRSLIFALLFAAVLTYAASAQGKTFKLNILYTGALQGELEPCGCSPKTDFGGVARLSGYLSKNKKGLSPYLLLDSGNFTGDDTPQGRLKTEAILNAFGTIGYDAVAYQKRESALPGDFLTPISDRNRLRTVYYSPYFTKTILLKKNSLNINIGTDPEKYREGRLNILLTELPAAEARAVRGWDVIILSSGEELEEPERTDDAILVSAYPKGKKLGVLTVEADSTGRIKNFRHRWQELGNDIKEDPAVRKALQEYDSKVAKLLADERRPSEDTPYLGVGRCTECHQPFVELWEKTRHAKAFASIEKAGKAADPECILCHATGAGGAGGFYSIGTTPSLANVQCEVCHGTGREHMADLSAPLPRPTEATCRKCHTKDQSPDFDYPAYSEKIKHWEYKGGNQ